MIDILRNDSDRRTSSSKDLEVILHALREAIGVIDDHDPVRNPARCMRQIRRLLDDVNVRVAVRRLAAEIPLVPDAPDTD
jgi:hypothetical protein